MAEQYIGLSGINIRPERLRALRPDVIDQLAESIRERGLINPITIRPRGKHGYWLIAGWHRYMAVKKLKLETIRCFIVDNLKADEAELIEIDENLIRADLTPAEEALHVDRRKELYETLHPETKKGAAGKHRQKSQIATSEPAPAFIDDLAKITGKHRSKGARAATRGKRGKAWLGQVAGTCLDKGDEIDALTKLPEQERDSLIKKAQAGEKKVSAKTELKKIKRNERERDLAVKQQALPEKRYGVIVADPEWRFEPWSRETGLDRAADNHYPTSVTEVIAARDVKSIATDDCVLFLWATVPMLPHALLVMAAWGFDYKSHYAWIKDNAGTGYWNREKHELLLIGVRGDIPCPAPGDQWESVISAPRLAHSQKPAQAMEMIEQYYPTLAKIELNLRGAPRPGWDGWGLEMQSTKAAE